MLEESIKCENNLKIIIIIRKVPYTNFHANFLPTEIFPPSLCEVSF